MKWRAWYTDGRLFDSESISWNQLPDSGVIVVMVYFDDRTRMIMSGSGSYWKAGDRFGRSRDPDDGAEEAPEGASVKRGSWCGDEEYCRIREAAMKMREAP